MEYKPFTAGVYNSINFSGWLKSTNVRQDMKIGELNQIAI